MVNNQRIIKYSIIIPIYNCEHYLAKCLDSVLRQSYQNLEVICVNDGSTDNTSNILEEFKQKDNRIKAINQINSGVSVARNVGIEHATGDYILFLDADDYMENTACDKLTDYIKNSDADLIQFQHKNIVYCGKFILYPYQKIINKPYYIFDNFKDSFPDKDYIFCWDRAYKVSFLKKHKCKFSVGQKFAEDFMFIVSLYAKNPKQLIIKDYIYNHVINPTSTCQSNNVYTMFESIKDINLWLFDEIYNENIDLYKYSLNTSLYYILRVWNPLYYSDKKDEYIQKINEYLKVLSDSKEFNSIRLAKKYFLIEHFNLSKIYWQFVFYLERYIAKFLFKQIIFAKIRNFMFDLGLIPQRSIKD